MNLEIIEHHPQGVLEAFRRGEFDQIEILGEADEKEFCELCFREKILLRPAQNLPTAREKEEVPRWFQLAANLSLKLHLENAYATCEQVMQAGGLLSALPPEVAAKPLDLQTQEIWLHCRGFNQENTHRGQVVPEGDLARGVVFGLEELCLPGVADAAGLSGRGPVMGQLVIRHFDHQISQLEEELQRQTQQVAGRDYALLRTVPGIGEHLGLTFLYGIGDIHRFPTVKDFLSYCRLVKGTVASAGKIKGLRGAKLGNPYLRWAFGEAAVIAKRDHFRLRPLAQRLEARMHGNKFKANTVVAIKLARAVCFMLNHQTVFDPDRLVAVLAKN
jgi:hypothetical protein